MPQREFWGWKTWSVLALRQGTNGFEEAVHADNVSGVPGAIPKTCGHRVRAQGGGTAEGRMGKTGPGPRVDGHLWRDCRGGVAVWQRWVGEGANSRPSWEGLGNDQAVGVTQLLCCWCSEADRRRAEVDPKPGTDGENHTDLGPRMLRPWGREKTSR